MHNPSMATRGTKVPRGMGQLKDPFKKCPGGVKAIDPWTNEVTCVRPPGGGGGGGPGARELKNPFGGRGPSWIPGNTLSWRGGAYGPRGPMGIQQSAWQPAGFRGGTAAVKQAGFAPATTFYRGAPVQAQVARGLGATVASRRATPAKHVAKINRIAGRRARAAARVSAAMMNVGIQPGVQRAACKSTKAAAEHGCGKGQTAFFNPGWKLWCCGAIR